MHCNLWQPFRSKVGLLALSLLRFVLFGVEDSKDSNMLWVYILQNTGRAKVRMLTQLATYR